MVRLLLVEDDAKLAASVARALERAAAGEWSVTHAATAAAARHAVDGQRVDLAIVDLGLPDEPGTQLIASLAARSSPVPAVAFTIFDDRKRVLEAVRAGAVGYLLKDDSVEHLVTHLRECMDGQMPVSSRIARHLFEACRLEGAQIELTPRERDVLESLGSGDSYAACAAKLHLGVGTVQTHVKSLYRKLNITTKSEAVAWARRYLP